MWILETEHINRSRVCEYLGSIRQTVLSSTGVRLKREDVPKAVLRKLASKICALEMAKGFVEGLKFFVPVVGCWDAVAASTSADEYLSSTPQHDESHMLNRILTEYVLAHMKYSDKPIFPAGTVNDSNVGLVVQVALCVLSLSKVLHDAVKSSSAAMADFFAALRAVLRDQRQAGAAALAMSMKTMTDLFTTTSTGLPLVSLSQSAAHMVGGHHHRGGAAVVSSPSYLFAQCALQGVLCVGTDLEQPFAAYFARLCSDALYLFELPTNNSSSDTTGGGRGGQSDTSADEPSPSSERGALLACVSLECVHLRTGAGDCGAHPSSCSPNMLLTLVPLAGRGLPFISYSTSSSSTMPGLGDGSSSSAASAQLLQCPVPESVAHPAQIYLRLPSSNTQGTSSASSSRAAGEQWVDALESACWECRASQARLKQ